MKKTFLFSAVIVVTFFILSELVLRLTISPLPSRPFEWPPSGMTKHGLTPDEHLFWKLRPDYNGRWAVRKLAYTHELAAKKEIDWQTRKRKAAPAYQGVTWEVNSQGLRGPSVSVDKPAETVRLLFIGSSITFGWGVRAESAFPEVVRRTLEADRPDLSFENLNAGVPGYSSHQGLRYLEVLLPRYKPDVVVAEFGINDGTMAVGRTDKEWEPGILNEIRLGLRNTGWARLVLRVFLPASEKPPIQDVWQTYAEAQKNFYRISMTGTLTRVAPDDFRTNLDRMAALCSKWGARFFVFIPCLYNEYGRGGLISSVDFQGPHALPVLEALSQHPRDELETLFLPFDEAHLSVRGHGVVGQGLAGFLKSAGISGEKSAKSTKR